LTLSAYIEGVGLLGPGLSGWTASLPILAGTQDYQPGRTVIPLPALLPAAERRRCGAIVKLSLATGLEAIGAAGLDAASLPSVFSSSGGDGENCHAICEMLASGDHQISPTRFHNSVHNIAAGYWAIATGSMATASVLCAYDGSFGAGLLEAMAQAVVDRTHVVLMACDTPYPDPIDSVRHIPDAFGVALVLAPQRGDHALARISIGLTGTQSDRNDDEALEALRGSVPAARALPLLCCIAQRRQANLVLDYLEYTNLAVDIAPC
jgi:hypothetical protein